MGGTFDGVLSLRILDLVRSLLWERFGSEGWVHARCWVLRGRALIALVGRLVLVGGCSSGAFSACHGCGWWGGYRPYFENYTVDASIFDMILRDGVVKMILKIISQFFDDSTHVISSL